MNKETTLTEQVVLKRHHLNELNCDIDIEHALAHIKSGIASAGVDKRQMQHDYNIASDILFVLANKE